MRFLFAILLLSNLTLAWFAWQQPQPDTAAYTKSNLPRVAFLELWSETAGRAFEAPANDESGSEIKARGQPDEPQRLSAVDVRHDFVEPPLLFELFLVPAGDGDPVQVAALDRQELQSDAELKPTCRLVSGFASEADVQAWSDSIPKGELVKVEFGTRSVADAPLHWVLVPPLPSRAAGQALLNKLRERQIDSYLITEPPHENAVSLGLFKSKSAAEAVLRKRRREGVDAVLAEYPRARDEHVAAVWATEWDALSGQLTDDLSVESEREACRVLQ